MGLDWFYISYCYKKKEKEKKTDTLSGQRESIK